MATQSFSAVRVSNSSPTANQSVGFWYDLSSIIKEYNPQETDIGLIGYDLATINSIKIELAFDANNNSSESISRSMDLSAKFTDSTADSTMLSSYYGKSYGTVNNEYSLQPGSQSVELKPQIISAYTAEADYTYLYLAATPGSNSESYVWLKYAPTITVDYTVPEAPSDPGGGTDNPTDPGGDNPSVSYSTRVTIVGPSGGSREYGVPVNFAFDVQTNGTLAEWRAQYSTDEGYNWSSLPVKDVDINSSNGPYEVRFSSPTIFPVGTVRWRVQAIANGESYGTTWTSASFNVTSTSTDPGGTTDPIVVNPGGDTPSNPSTTSYNTRISIITPYGGTFSYGSTIKFGFDVQTNGTLAEWRAQYSTDDGYSWKTLPTKNVTTSSSNGPIEVRFSSSTRFPVGTVRWRVQAIANGESYGTTWTSASFTIADNSGSGDSSIPADYVYDDTTGTWVPSGTSDSNSVYTVSCSIIQPSNGSKRSGSADIPFKFSVKSSGAPAEYQAEYSTDEGLTWNALAQDSIASGQNEIIFTVPRMTLPSGLIEWRVRARANGDWQYDWTSTSFTVTYDGYGSIQATSGPINSGALGTSSIRYDAAMQLIGETIGQPTLIEARFCWRSGNSSDYIERSMVIANNSAYIIIPVDTFPYGLIQWYMYGKDSSGIESETPVYATYILKSTIDSFPIKPVSSIEQSENAIEFKWGYISLNGHQLKKYEIQFSEDGVTWVTVVSSDFVEDLEEEVPLIPPSGEDVFEEEVGE